MLGRRKALVSWIVLVAVSLTLSACGGSSAKEQTTPAAATNKTSSGAKDISPAGVQSCLTAAGLEVVASGDLPIIQRSKAVGVRLPGGGKIKPGNLSAAIFWYGSAAEAERMHESVKFKFTVLRVDEIVAIFDPVPSADAQTKILGCISPDA
ncbi:MAG: hypothetical protein WBQ14_04025 [Gaiellaceae bacterium]